MMGAWFSHPTKTLVRWTELTVPSSCDVLWLKLKPNGRGRRFACPERAGRGGSSKETPDLPGQAGTRYARLMAQGKGMVGARRFELRTSCAQGRRASLSKPSRCNMFSEKSAVSIMESLCLAAFGCARLIVGSLQKSLQPLATKNFPSPADQ